MVFPTKIILQERIGRFTAFLDEQENCTFREIEGTSRKHHYVVSNGAELASIIFNHTASMQLIAKEGWLRELILSWIEREGCPYYDNTTKGQGQLEAYRSLLEHGHPIHAPSEFPPPGGLLLTSQETPLVELAELLGYDVFLLPAVQDFPRYGLANQQEVVLWGTHLPTMFVWLVTGSLSEDQEKVFPNFSSRPVRNIYLPRAVSHPLAYWRQHTQTPGGSSMTQQELAKRAGLDVSTIRQLERETRETGPQVYLNAVRSIVAALNIVREQQDLPLIQLWNIDWAPRTPKKRIYRGF